MMTFSAAKTVLSNEMSIPTRVPHPYLAVIALAAALGLLLCSATLPAATTPPAERKPAPGFALRSSNRATIELSRYKGRVVLLDFWATWCHGCKTEVPWYIEFQKKYMPRGLSVIGVSMDSDGWRSVRPFLKRHRLNYPVVIGNDDLTKLYAVQALPVTLLIDRNGRIAEAHAGVVEKSAFAGDVEAPLREPTPRIVR
ncbi:MAG TPA: TlpA disulfide reductase family protein [Candidatus Acidoferrales bacterium]|nr:TlpA disulfide reductase family protein [Candidatus Acidoferrales bacterium]